MGVGLVVERRDLAVASGPVQADRLAQGVVGFQLDRANPVRRGLRLQFGQQPPAQAQPADRRGDPHPLDMRGRVVVELEDSASDRLAVQGGKQEQARGRGHLVVAGGDAPGRVKALLEALRQLGLVGPDGVAGVRVPGIAHPDLDRRGDQEPLDLGHRHDQPVPLPGAERFEDGRGRVVGEPVELGVFGPAAFGQAGRPHPSIGVARPDQYQVIVLQ